MVADLEEWALHATATEQFKNEIGESHEAAYEVQFVRRSRHRSRGNRLATLVVFGARMVFCRSRSLRDHVANPAIDAISSFGELVLRANKPRVKRLVDAVASLWLGVA